VAQRRKQKIPEADNGMPMLPHRLIAEFGLQRWRYIASFVRGRSGKQVRERWRNQLDPCLNKDMFKPEEDEIIVSSWLKFGNREQKSPTTQSPAHGDTTEACAACRRPGRDAMTMIIMEGCADYYGGLCAEDKLDS